jgi:S1-C subfamily serine protease
LFLFFFFRTAARPRSLGNRKTAHLPTTATNKQNKKTAGIVGGIGREIQSISGRPILGAIQHDAPINPGSSGGPLLDTGGCFVGTNTAILSPSGASAGVGFAIPSELVASSVQQILDNGRVVRPVLGLSFAPDSSAEQLGVRGILVLSAREGGPAWRAGVRGTQRDDFGRLVLGDIVVAVDGAPVRSSSDLYAALDKSGVGKEMELTLLRGSETVTVSATLDPSS